MKKKTNKNIIRPKKCKKTDQTTLFLLFDRNNICTTFQIIHLTNLWVSTTFSRFPIPFVCFPFFVKLFLWELPRSGHKSFFFYLSVHQLKSTKQSDHDCSRKISKCKLQKKIRVAWKRNSNCEWKRHCLIQEKEILNSIGFVRNKYLQSRRDEWFSEN